MSRHLTRKRPTGSGSFSWARIVDRPGVVTYRLYRRDLHGVLHCEWNTIAAGEQRWYIALWLRGARKTLRDLVDEIDLSILGVTA